MTIKGNYHTHTTWCDGKASPEDFVQEALKNGLEYLGFSAHAMFPFDSDWHLKVEDYRDYFTAILELKDKYSDRIQILTGLEADFIPPATKPDYKIYRGLPLDYIIGSVHYISRIGKSSAEWFTVDGPIEEFSDGLNRIFEGNGKALVEDYFAREREMALTTDCDIIGHPDLIRLRNETLHYFDENASWYKDELAATAEAFAKSGKVVEINTGGMARIGMTSPYPGPEMLKMLCAQKVPVMINTDAHTPGLLTYGFDEAVQSARNAGYKEIRYLTRNGWETMNIM